MKVHKSVRPQGGCAGARNIHCLLARIVLAIGLTTSVSGPSEAATYYASPGGSGDGRTERRPFQVADFWQQAKPGDTLLLDGRYRGGASMITPTPNLKGEPGRPITVRALHDGRVEMDGENTRRPVKLYQNDSFVLEGFNGHSAYGGRDNASVVTLSRSNLCFRYRDGVLTGEPLWPWPMHRRIIGAMKSAGYVPVDVTATIEKLLGPIPQPSQ